MIRIHNAVRVSSDAQGESPVHNLRIWLKLCSNDNNKICLEIHDKSILTTHFARHIGKLVHIQQLNNQLYIFSDADALTVTKDQMRSANCSKTAPHHLNFCQDPLYF